MVAAQEVYNASGTILYHLRTREQIAAFFGGLDLVEPGGAKWWAWRPDRLTEQGPPGAYGAVARIP